MSLHLGTWCPTDPYVQGPTLWGCLSLHHLWPAALECLSEFCKSSPTDICARVHIMNMGLWARSHALQCLFTVTVMPRRLPESLLIFNCLGVLKNAWFERKYVTQILYSQSNVGRWSQTNPVVLLIDLIISKKMHKFKYCWTKTLQVEFWSWWRFAQDYLHYTKVLTQGGTKASMRATKSMSWTGS